MKTKLMTVCLIALAGVIGWQQRQIHQCQKRLDESAYLKSAISSVSERANKTENMLSKMYAQPDGELFKLMMSAAQEPFKDYEREEKIKDLESKVVTLDRKIEDRVMDVEARLVLVD